MIATNRSTRMLAFAAGTALATLAIGGCATKSAPRADLSATKADVALKKGNVSDAIAHAEAAVLGDPRNAGYRAMLGAAYMEAGRFVSARTSFDDAMTLGDESARTALGFALAAIASGDRTSALEVLEDWRDDIPAADLGLATALAGNTAQAVQILSNAVRGGDRTPKTRQNLAYALALNGDWGAARIMAAEDVPLDQLESRMAQWASLASGDQAQNRVAALLGTRAVADGGQPAALALANHPTTEQLAAEASAFAPPVADAPVSDVAYTGGELPAVGTAPSSPPAPAVAVATPRAAPQADFQAAFAAPAPAPAPFAATPATKIERAAEPRRVASRTIERTVPAGGNHLVQLGSFSSEAGARRAWGIYAKRFPQLSRYAMVVTRAVVRGKTFFRVSAGGMARTEATGICSSVRRGGGGCYAWAEGRPLKGGIARSPTRMASR